uniref:Uncharacterized protein n=1 Tax=Glossina palpalis gambiensis TaxID=67801 RepID=A0A1B0ARG4_9MUSC
MCGFTFIPPLLLLLLGDCLSLVYGVPLFETALKYHHHHRPKDESAVSEDTVSRELLTVVFYKN